MCAKKISTKGREFKRISQNLLKNFNENFGENERQFLFSFTFWQNIA